VTASNFSSCLKEAENKEILSLDFIFTTILNLKLKINSPLLAKVFRFVWKISESIEKRNLCVQFLADFIKVRKNPILWCLGVNLCSFERGKIQIVCNLILRDHSQAPMNKSTFGV